MTGIGAVLLGYLLGSVPFSVWLGKWWFHKDVRQFGSGNPGATNALRVFGPSFGLLVFLLDALKGWLPLWLILNFLNEAVALEWIGISAVLGHMFSVFLGFKGGKGAATSLGVLSFFHWGWFVVAIVLFGVGYGLQRRVSLGTLLAGLCVSIGMWLPLPLWWNQLPWVRPFNPFLGLYLMILILLAHHSNIRRLIQKQEPKTFWRKQF
jgi:glycerol-3-phosphate acyltransferase PlsY